MSIKVQSPVRPCPQQLGSWAHSQQEARADSSHQSWRWGQGHAGAERHRYLTQQAQLEPAWGGGGGPVRLPLLPLPRWANALTPPSPSLQVERAGAAGRPPLPLHRARVPAQHHRGQPAPHRPPLPGAEPQGRGHWPAAPLIPAQPAPSQW